MSANDRCLYLPCQLIAEEGRVLALAGEGFRIDFPALGWIEDANIGTASDRQISRMQPHHARRIRRDFCNRPSQGLLGFVQAFVTPLERQR